MQKLWWNVDITIKKQNVSRFNMCARLALWDRYRDKRHVSRFGYEARSAGLSVEGIKV